MPLVEVVPHPGTEETYVTCAVNFYRSIGKEPILIKQETPGFIANRLQMALCNEAYSLVSRGIVSAADIGEWCRIQRLYQRCTDNKLQTPVSRLPSVYGGR